MEIRQREIEAMQRYEQFQKMQQQQNQPMPSQPMYGPSSQ